jgi:hypothetical protein
MVRSNENGQIGFLSDLRRMNVAITRARMKLIILGDVSTLTRHPFYLKLWNYIQVTNEGHTASTEKTSLGTGDQTGTNNPEKDKEQ